MFARRVIKSSVIALATFACIFFCHPAGAAPASGASNAVTSASECLIVYPLDQLSPEQGSRYLFYGNAFFINDDGYLMTAAHVVSAFRKGGQPYVLVGPKGGPRHLVQAELVAADWAHDVAVLRATPNPFASDYGVRALPLTIQRQATGNNLLVLSLLPHDQQNANTAETLKEDHESGKLLSFQFSQGETEGTDRELLAVSQPIVPGQSGSPVLAADSGEVVGVVLGRWLRPGVMSLATSADPVAAAPGAVLPIHYAVALLHEWGIAWQTVAADPLAAQNAPPAAEGSSPPVPISLVSTPYPPQALFGGEVVLEASVDASGQLTDLAVVSGQPPFLGPVLDAVRTWSFEPARLNRNPVEGSLTIVFQFPQSYVPPLTSQERTFPAAAADSSDRAAVPLYTREPNYPPRSVIDGSVAIFATVDEQGQVSSTRVLRDIEPLTDATLDALRVWRFAPARRDGENVESSAVVVITFRRPAIR
jgi:outer membrane biosynthesis protein TonB